MYPGTFRKVEKSFALSDAAPFDGDAIVVVRSHQPGTDAPIPFTLRSRFTEDMQARIANGGITVKDNATVPITVIFDLDALFGSLDFASAVVEGGEILIDAAHNHALLTGFELNLGDSLHAGEHDD